jgi:hypothetical protein
MQPSGCTKEAAMGAVYIVVAFVGFIFGVMSFAGSNHVGK